MNAAPQTGGFNSAIWLTFVMAVGWVACFWPARMLNGHSGVSWMTLAAFCCLVPGWIVVFLSQLATFRSDLLAMVIQTLLRLVLVGAVALVVVVQRPEIGVSDFYGWLIGFYLLALTAETVLNRPAGRDAG